MIDANKDRGKLHLILDLLERKDLRKTLDEKLSDEEQVNLFLDLKKSIELNVDSMIRRKTQH